MTRPPTQGVVGSKPRLPKAESGTVPLSGNGGSSKEELAKLSEEYLRTRNSQMRSKAAVAEMELERRRGELISKKWAYASLSYLLVVFRQRMLQSPTAIARQLAIAGLVDAEKEHATSELLRREVHALLTELADLPEKVTDPDWLRTLEREEGAGTPSPERRESPEQVKAEQARIEKRRAQKAATMRKLREQG